MSEEIAQAASDRAAELAAIRRRTEKESYSYGEDWVPEGDGAPYLASAWLLLSGSKALDLEEPGGAECIALRDLVQAQSDRRTLLTRLDEVEAERDQYLADFTAELDGGKEMRKVLGARDGETLWGCVERVAAERDAIAQAAESAVTALNAAVQRLGEQLADCRAYLERLPSRTPERERLITAIHVQLGPGSSRIDELP